MGHENNKILLEYIYYSKRMRESVCVYALWNKNTTNTLVNIL